MTEASFHKHADEPRKLRNAGTNGNERRDIMATTTQAKPLERREISNLIGSDKVEGTTVCRPDGERVGQIERIMIDKLSGQVAYAFMSFGGFLGIGEDYYPLPWSLPHLKTGWRRGERHRGPTPKYGTHETRDCSDTKSERSRRRSGLWRSPG